MMIVRVLGPDDDEAFEEGEMADVEVGDGTEVMSEVMVVACPLESEVVSRRVMVVGVGVVEVEGGDEVEAEDESLVAVEDWRVERLEGAVEEGGDRLEMKPIWRPSGTSMTSEAFLLSQQYGVL